MKLVNPSKTPILSDTDFIGSKNMAAGWRVNLPNRLEAQEHFGYSETALPEAISAHIGSLLAGHSKQHLNRPTRSVGRAPPLLTNFPAC